MDDVALLPGDLDVRIADADSEVWPAALELEHDGVRSVVHLYVRDLNKPALRRVDRVLDRDVAEDTVSLQVAEVNADVLGHGDGAVGRDVVGRVETIDHPRLLRGGSLSEAHEKGAREYERDGRGPEHSCHYP